jgi:flagellar assembly factor FliW
MWKEQKSDPLSSVAIDHFLFFPHYDVILYIYERIDMQRQNLIYLLNIMHVAPRRNGVHKIQ